jgi:hypothetical protein
MAEVVECLPSKSEPWVSIPRTAKEKKKLKRDNGDIN